MEVDPFSAPGKFWRGNLHTHSTRSDGVLDPDEVARRYQLEGYDFLAMTMGAGSENDGADMGQYIKNIMLLKSIFNCHVMIIHHSGKDRGKGARGHSNLRAAVDTEI